MTIILPIGQLLVIIKQLDLCTKAIETRETAALVVGELLPPP